MLLEHDESTYYQFLFSKKHWKGLVGLNFVQIKGIVEIIMLSGLQIRLCELGLSCLSIDEIRRVINSRRLGYRYQSLVVAKIMNKDEFKKDILTTLY